MKPEPHADNLFYALTRARDLQAGAEAQAAHFLAERDAARAERDSLAARAKELERKVMWMETEADAAGTALQNVELRDVNAALQIHVDSLSAQLAACRAAIQTHSESFAVCDWCSHETPAVDDDVCLVLSSPSTAAADYTARIRREAAREERERCAVVAEGWQEFWGLADDVGGEYYAKRLALVIRALGDPEPTKPETGETP